MKCKSIVFILILSIICLSGCMVKESQDTGVSASTNTKSTTSEKFFAEKDAYAIKILSEAAASAVWQYGNDLGWTKDDGPTNLLVTPRQLAMSQRTYKQALIYWCSEDPIKNNLDTEKEALYAQTLFPGIRVDELPMTDEFSDWSQGINVLTNIDTASTLFSTASADGKSGYVIVMFLYQNENGHFEKFYQVEWKKKDPSNTSGLFPYQLVGVRPMERFFLGGLPEQEFSEKYLGPTSTGFLKKFGVNHPIGTLDRPGAWGTWDTQKTIVIRTVSLKGNERLATYILVDDNNGKVTYLGATDLVPSEHASKMQLITVLQAKNILYSNYVDAELFYPMELNKWKDSELCYGFVYNDGDKTRYVWINSLTCEVEFADEIKDYENRQF